MEDLKNYINSYNEGVISEGEFIDFIIGQDNCDYTGTDSDGDTIVVTLRKGVGIEVRTFQKNEWIRIYRYEIVEDAEGNPCIVESEAYDK